MVNPGLGQGEDIPAILSALDIPQDRVLIADQYRVVFDPYAPSAMAKIYNAMDVLLNPAMGEGFGITVLEAQACGVPAIVTDFTAMREVCGAGWHVKHQPYWTGLGSWQAIPDVDDIVSALGGVLRPVAGGTRHKMAQGARGARVAVRPAAGAQAAHASGAEGG
jgi:glycosyltransferase involved in cell wall biosynthesis